jgi:GAF domain-containing protein
VSSKLDLHALLAGDATPAQESTDFAAVISELALSLEEALSRERAMAEVLRIISRSRGDTDAVVSSILGHALELCEAEFGILFDYHGHNRFEATHDRGIPDAFHDWLKAQGAFVVGARTGLGRLASGLAPANIFDVRAEEIFHSDDPLRWATAHLGGARSFVAIPMMSGKGLAGAFTIYRQTVRPFSEAAVLLAQSFADQSVIALENARLFAALKDGGAAS